MMKPKSESDQIHIKRLVVVLERLDEGSMRSSTSSMEQVVLDKSKFILEEAQPLSITTEPSFGIGTRTKRKGRSTIVQNSLRQTPRRVYNCNFCRTTYRNPFLLRDHLNAHIPNPNKNHGQIKLECSKCGKVFSSTYSLNRHWIFHWDKMPFQCFEPDCGKYFATAGNLKYHMLTHAPGDNDGYYFCNFCRKRIRNSNQFRTHIKAHIPNPVKNHGSIKWECSKCGKSYYCLSALNRHWLDHLEKKPFPCLESGCNTSHATAKELRRHSFTHSKEVICCPICNFQAKNPKNLTMHMQHYSKMSGSPFTCQVCGQKICSPAKYETHLRDHNQKFEDKHIGCEVCGKDVPLEKRISHARSHSVKDRKQARMKCKFCQKLVAYGKLEIHMRTHTGECPFSCTICGRRFNQWANKRAHEKVHQVKINKHKIQCEKCFQKMSDTAALQIHKAFCGIKYEYYEPLDPNIQTCNTSYRCKLCPEISKGKRIIQNHVQRYHLKLKPYPCSHCEMKYCTRDELIKHNTSHTDERPFKCRLCNQGFRRTSHLKEHEKTVHTELRPFVCPNCPKSFKTKHCLSKHIVTHTKELPFVCQLCGKGYPRFGGLNRHINLHHNKIRPFKCDIRNCEKAFLSRTELKVHQVGHSAERPFPCDACGFDFKSKSVLRQHFRSKMHIRNTSS